MSLQELGWNTFFQALRGDGTLRPARVIAQDSDSVLVDDGSRQQRATVRGRLCELANFPPVVGDWVEIASTASGGCTIEAILDRRTAIVRKRAGSAFGAQVLAANVDRVLLVMSLDQDFSLRRLERYLTLIWDGGATPIIVLSKSDLVDDPLPFARDVERRALGFPVIPVSNVSGQGQEELASALQAPDTMVLLGSSGAGKSSLVNALAGAQLRQTGPVRASDGKGRHTTTDRHLLRLPSGILVIDTPGLREVQLWVDESALDQTFSEIAEAAAGCRFRDCRHDGEPGCAVTTAVEQGWIEPERLRSFHQLRAELERVERQNDPRRASEYKSEVKKIHRAQKQHQKMSRKR